MFFRDLTFSHFGTILACDRQTDRKLECLMMWPCNIVTGPQYMPRYSIASRGKKTRSPRHSLLLCITGGPIWSFWREHYEEQRLEPVR